jgi:hypothetical protein
MRSRIVPLLIHALLFTIAAMVLLWIYPQPLFVQHARHGQFEVWSDQPLPASLAPVLDDAMRRMRTSELAHPDDAYHVFICNASWRIWLFGGHFSERVGGFADTVITRNIYIRAADFNNNRLLLWPGAVMADPELRPLSYYIAHEAAHVMESRAFGRLMYLRHPVWLTEGYADYVGKGGQFDFEETRQLLLLGRLNARNGNLYRQFHLQVYQLVDRQKMDIRRVFDAPPDEAAILAALRVQPAQQRSQDEDT